MRIGRNPGEDRLSASASVLAEPQGVGRRGGVWLMMGSLLTELDLKKLLLLLLLLLLLPLL